MTSLFHHPYCKPFIRHPFESIKCFFISLKWAYQRVKKGYCDRDLIFGVDNWLLELLPEMVDEIKEEKSGAPLAIYNEVIASMDLSPDEYWDGCNNDVYEKYCGQIEAEAEKRWSDILSRISFLLREVYECSCEKSNDEYCEQCKREALELLLKWSGYLEI